MLRVAAVITLALFVVTSIVRELNDKVVELVLSNAVPRAAYAPLMATTIFGCLTWLFANAAAQLQTAADYEISGGSRDLKALFAWLLEVLGPTGVWVVGGGIVVLCGMSLIQRVKQPPVTLIMQEAPYKAPSNIKLVFKYGILAVIWFVVLRVFMA